MHEYVGRDQTCGLQKLQVAPLTAPLFLEGRDQSRADAARVEESARLAQQEATRAQAAADAAREETGRVRADAEKMLAGFRAEAAAELAAVRADLRARAERAENQADAYRAELAELRAGTGHDAAR
jgi:hypothetical protein